MKARFSAEESPLGRSVFSNLFFTVRLESEQYEC